jgi:phosphatidylserine/phosphatidylglycerophosphate/cardiolipin synthase-like enzyme
MTKRLIFALLTLILASLACVVETVPVIVTVDAPPPTIERVETVLAPVMRESGEISLDAGYGYENAFYEIYFTDPLSPSAKMERGGPDERLAAAIDEARLSVDLAVYSMSAESVRDALIRAHRRGVTVRIVMESTNMERSAPQRLMNAGIEIIGDQREGLMHNKFVIIDRAEVWLGSANFTTSGFYDENNNVVRIRSKKIAENYQAEFNEMFEMDFFGADVWQNTPHPLLVIDGIAVETYFSPDDGVGRRILELLKDAEKSIYFMAFSFTTDDFGETIINKARQGLAVAGVMDESQVKSNTGGEYAKFSDAQLNVYLDGIPGHMHHKVMIIDEEIVIFGSYNFSISAETRNDETVMIIFDPDFAAQFMSEFWRVYEQAQR